MASSSADPTEDYRRLGTALNAIIATSDQQKKDNDDLKRDNLQLKRQVEDIISDRDRIKRQLHAATADKTSLEDRLSLSTRQLQECEQQVIDLKRELTSIQDTLKVRVEEAVSLERDKAELKIRLDEARKSLEDNRKSNEETLKVERDLFRVQTEQLRREHDIQVSSLKTSLEESQARYLAREERMNQNEACITQLREEVTNITRGMDLTMQQVEQDRNDLNERHKNEVNQLKRQLDARDEELARRDEKMRQMIESHANEVRRLEAEKNDVESGLQIQISSVRAEITQLKLDMNDMTLNLGSEKEALINTHQEEVSKLKLEIEHLFDQLRTKEDSLQKTLMERDELNFQMQSHRNAYDQEINVLKSTHDQRMKEFTEQHEQRVSSLEAEVNKIRVEASKVRIDLESKIAAVEDEKARMTAEHVKQIDRLQKESQQRLESEKERLSASIRTFEQEKATTSKEVDRTKSLYEDKVTELRSTYELKILNKQHEINRLQGELAELKIEAEKDVFRITSEKESVESKYRSELAQLSSELRFLEGQVKERDQRLKERQGETDGRELELLGENTRLREKDRQLQASINALEGQTTDITNRLTALMNKLQEKDDCVSELRKTLKEVEETRRALLLENQDLKSQTAHFTSELQTLSREKLNLSEQLDQEKGKKTSDVYSLQGIKTKLTEQELQNRLLQGENQNLKAKMKELELKTSVQEDKIVSKDCKIMELQREIRDKCHLSQSRPVPQTPGLYDQKSVLSEPSFLIKPSRSMMSLTESSTPVTSSGIPVFKKPAIPPSTSEQSVSHSRSRKTPAPSDFEDVLSHLSRDKQRVAGLNSKLDDIRNILSEAEHLTINRVRGDTPGNLSMNSTTSTGSKDRLKSAQMQAENILTSFSSKRNGCTLPSKKMSGGSGVLRETLFSTNLPPTTEHKCSSPHKKSSGLTASGAPSFQTSTPNIHSRNLTRTNVKQVFSNKQSYEDISAITTASSTKKIT